jgi:diphosphomevalonate decarboxylase
MFNGITQDKKLMKKVTARANPNIAFIKYWGNQDDDLKIPQNSSLSMNLDGLYTETTVEWLDALTHDELVLNGQPNTDVALVRVSRHLDVIRRFLHFSTKARVVSHNNFPMGAGIASSASSFAALTVAAVGATETPVNEQVLTTIARIGSGSASRSIPTGFVEWYQGDSHETSYAKSIATPEHWDIVDVIAVVSDSHKKTGSEAGHPTAKTSDLQSARVAGAQKRLEICRQALLERDFGTFADVVELDSNLMHAVMMTSQPSLFYWLPTTLAVMQAVRQWRQEGLAVCYTLDAGPNVHCICQAKDAPQVARLLQQIDGILDIRQAKAGQGASITQVE